MPRKGRGDLHEQDVGVILGPFVCSEREGGFQGQDWNLAGLILQTEGRGWEISMLEKTWA